MIVLVLLLATPPSLLLVYGVLPPPVTPLMIIRLFEGEGLEKDWVPLSRISPALPKAVIAAEDNFFCRHWGFDWKALGEVVQRYAGGERSRGASTISMQTAKNVMLWPGRSLVRKGAEAYVTLWMELLWNKERILEVYLNVAEWGPGLYGAEAAARHHFGRPADELTPRQAALMAAVLPNPRVMNAGKPSDWVSRRASVLQRRVGQLGPLLDCVPDA